MNYYELTIHLSDFENWNDIFVAYLSELKFESFQVEAPIVRAYIQEAAYDGKSLQELLEKVQVKNKVIDRFEVKIIPQQNWNAEWESQFEPVFINKELRIVAPFHVLAPFDGIEVVIEPKMSFGTGHHQTTHLMCASMLQVDFNGAHVLDMGSGTGVLAILAEKIGAARITAIDIEAWSTENCLDNAKRNKCRKIESIHGGLASIPKRKFDVILANINKNVLKAQMATYAKRMKTRSYLFLSGFFVADTDELKLLASRFQLHFHAQHELEGWAVLIFKK